MWLKPFRRHSSAASRWRLPKEFEQDGVRLTRAKTAASVDTPGSDRIYQEPVADGDCDGVGLVHHVAVESLGSGDGIDPGGHWSAAHCHVVSMLTLSGGEARRMMIA